MSTALLRQRTDIWRGGETPAASGETIPTGFTALDEALPGGGWPLGALTEILVREEGMGGLWLTMPALARLSRGKRWLAWIAPPYIPYAPALADMGVDLAKILLVRPRARSDGLWAVEQALRSGTCGAVLAWPAGPDARTLRRLQLAAEKGHTWGLCFRPRGCARQPSTAALRLEVDPTPRGVRVNVLKCRGARPGKPLELRFAGTCLHPPETNCNL